ncbi:MAG: hypothetical protein O3C21_12445 [Verrucomicrobia bacterium]|nr:hypothetical protein [Verrucomicrobiota bacterium]
MAFAGFEYAAANHIPGATYDGVHSGGGTVLFRVSTSGSGVERFEMRDVPCGFSRVTIGIDFSPPSPIDQSHNFSHSGGGTQRPSFTGSFPIAGEAEGTLRYQQSNIPFVQPGCDSGILDWSTIEPPNCAGNLNGDGTTDGADLAEVFNCWGQADTAPNSVPEPVGLGWLGLGLTSLATRRQAKCATV